MRTGYDQIALMQLAADQARRARGLAPFGVPMQSKPGVGAHTAQLDPPSVAAARAWWIARYGYYPYDAYYDPAAYYGYDPYVLTPAPAWYIPYPYPYFPGSWGGWGWGRGRRRGWGSHHHGGHHHGH